MSNAKTKRPRLRFCWVCSRQLQGRHHRVVLTPEDAQQVVVHIGCAEGLTVVIGAHIADGAP